MIETKDGSRCKYVMKNKPKNIVKIIAAIYNVLMKNNKLKTIKGTRVKLQYFNGYLVHISLLFSIPLVYALYFGKYSEIIPAFFEVLKIESPIIMLSVANRFLFGRIACVVTDEGIHTDKAFVAWNTFDSVILDVGMALPTKRGMDYSSVTLVMKDCKITIDKTPLYLLRYIKKHRPDVKITLTDGSKFFIKLVVTCLIISYLAIIMFAK